MPADPPLAIDPRFRCEGHAIVSADGMIAEADGSMPAVLRNDADWRAFQAALDRAAVVVLGRLGHARHPNPGRRRLVLTGAVSGLEPDPDDPAALYWNPAGAGFDTAMARLGLAKGLVAIAGGTRVFDRFLGHYHAFELSECHAAVLPGGTPCFSAGHPRSILAASGLVPGPAVPLDATGSVTATRWVVSG